MEWEEEQIRMRREERGTGTGWEGNGLRLPFVRTDKLQPNRDYEGHKLQVKEKKKSHKNQVRDRSRTAGGVDK